MVYFSVEIYNRVDRDGIARSSSEALVIKAEPRGYVIQFYLLVNQILWEELKWKRQSCLRQDNKSRMSRLVYLSG